MWNAQEIRDRIKTSIPEGSVITAHTEKGHFYKIMTPDKKGVVGNVYPSVTGKLQVIKDESLINYKKNQVLQYMFRNYKKFTDNNIMEHLSLAERVPEDILSDAGDIGTDIHDVREAIFSKWIETGTRPSDFLSFIPAEKVDVRIRSGIRALDKFCTDYNYVPVATELFVYSHKLRVAGTLDDIGLMKDGEFVLLDLKTSNAFKDHYFFQVAMYYLMLRELTGLKPDRCFILKVSKEDGTYKLEDLKRPAMLGSYARSMLRTTAGIEFIRGLRKDNQKIVGDMVEL